jgi:hypothetical protein
VIIIDFSKDIAIPKYSYETLKERGYVNMTVTGPYSDYKFDWNIVTIADKVIQFSIQFENPKIIGTKDVNNNI